MTHMKSELGGIASFWVVKRLVETGSGCKTLIMPSIHFADGDKVEKDSNQTDEMVWGYRIPVSDLLILTKCFSYSAKKASIVYPLLIMNLAVWTKANGSPPKVREISLASSSSSSDKVFLESRVRRSRDSSPSERLSKVMNDPSTKDLSLLFRVVISNEPLAIVSRENSRIYCSSSKLSKIRRYLESTN